MINRLSSSRWLIVTTLVVIVLGFGIGQGQEPTTPQAAPAKGVEPTPKQKGAKSTPLTTVEKATSAETTGDQTTTAVPQTPPTTVVSSTTEQTDLSGTYAGTFKCDEAGLTGDTTLTITGNQFTTADGKNGRIVAATTKGYTAVALQVGDDAAPAPAVISLRGRKSGDKLTLTAADAAHPCSFTPARAIASRRSRRAEAATPAAVGTEVASPAEVGPAPSDVMPARKTKRASRKTTKATNATMPPPSAVPAETPMTVTIPVQNQEPSPSPSPSPTTSPAPTPDPSPGASPGPSPSPSPSPAVKRP